MKTTKTTLLLLVLLFLPVFLPEIQAFKASSGLTANIRPSMITGNLSSNRSIGSQESLGSLNISYYQAYLGVLSPVFSVNPNLTTNGSTTIVTVIQGGGWDVSAVIKEKIEYITRTIREATPKQMLTFTGLGILIAAFTYGIAKKLVRKPKIKRKLLGFMGENEKKEKRNNN